MRLSLCFLGFLFALAALQPNLYAQKSGNKSKSKKPAKQETPASVLIESTEESLTVFYGGIDNPVRITPTGIDIANVELSSDKATFTPTSDAHVFNVKLTTTQRAGMFSIKASNKKSGALISEKQFSIKTIPDPQIQFFDITSGEVSASDAKTQTELKMSLGDLKRPGVQCQIVSFTMMHTPAGKPAARFEASGSAFKGAVAQAIQAASVGDQYQFTNIKARCPGDQASRAVNNVAITIK